MSGNRSCIVQLSEGKIKGKIEKDYHDGRFFSFMGIPYGKAPIGSLRFKAPEAVEPWEGVRNCKKEGPECPSIHNFVGYYIGEEKDCLNLCVYTKELPSGDQELGKPVMVFIHGGGFIFGSNKRELYGPEFLMTQDIVLVVINYRIGMLGFLAMEDPDLGVPGNAGLKDQVLALKWVQRNIKNFGGDPKNVTIFGESAGGASVHLLILSPRAKGLFHKAIMQSGVAGCPFARGCYNGKEIGAYFKYPETDEATILKKLREEPSKRLVYTQLKNNKEHIVPRLQRSLGYVVENCAKEEAFLPEEPEAIMRSGNYNQVPIIIGYNSNEGLLFEVCKLVFKHIILPGNLEYELPVYLNLEMGSEKSKEAAKKLKEFYFKNKDCFERPCNELYQMKGDIGFKYDIYITASLLKETNKFPVYFYRFDFDGALNLAKTSAVIKNCKLYFLSLLIMKLTHWCAPISNCFQGIGENMSKRYIEGASHGDDLCLLFRTSLHPKVLEGTMEDESVQKMVQLWSNFARTNNPTPPEEKQNPDSVLDRITWEPVGQDFNYLELRETLSMSKNPDQEAMNFLIQLYQEYNNNVKE